MKYEGSISKPLVESVDYKRIHGDEDWEAEATIKESYNPYKMTAAKQILRKIEGATESERREFRDQEKRRLEELKKKSEVNKNGILLQRMRNSQESLKVQHKVDVKCDFYENPRQPSLIRNSRGRGKISHAPMKVRDDAPTPAVGVKSQLQPPHQQGKSRGRGRLVWGRE